MIEFALIAQALVTAVLVAVIALLKSKVNELERVQKHERERRYENMNAVEKLRDELRQVADACGVEWVPTEYGKWRKT